MNGMKDWLKWHFEVQKGMYFDEEFADKSFSYYASKQIPDSVWNYGVVDALSKKTLCGFEHFCSDIGKPANLYIPFVSCNYNEELLIANGFLRPEDEDGKLITETWMRFRKTNYKVNNDVVIKLVKSQKEKDDFLQVFLEAYGGEKTPDKPYGELPDEYANALIASLENKKFFNFVCYADRIPVSVASLCFSKGYGGLYNIGTKPNFEKHGYGLAVTDACIRQWKALEGKELFLQTETGTGIDDWYARMGFEKMFYGAVYEKR